jgi:hypothetical protein
VLTSLKLSLDLALLSLHRHVKSRLKTCDTSCKPSLRLDHVEIC